MNLVRPNEHEPFDHIAWGVPNLDDGLAEFERRTGVAPFVPPQTDAAAAGTVSGVARLQGRSSIEILAPTPGSEPTGLGRLLARRAEPGLMFWYAAYHDLRALLAELNAMGIPTTALETYDMPTISFRRAYVADHIFNPAVPYLIQWGRRDEGSGREAPRITVESFWVEHTEPGSLDRIYDALGIEVDCREGGIPTTRLVLNTPNGIVEL